MTVRWKKIHFLYFYKLLERFEQHPALVSRQNQDSSFSLCSRTKKQSHLESLDHHLNSWQISTNISRCKQFINQPTLIQQDEHTCSSYFPQCSQFTLTYLCPAINTSPLQTSARFRNTTSKCCPHTAAHVETLCWKLHISQRWSDRRGNTENFGSRPCSYYSLPVVELFTLGGLREPLSIHVNMHCARVHLACLVHCSVCVCRGAFAAAHIEWACGEQQRWIIHHCLSKKKEKWLLHFLPLSNSWINLLTSAANVLQPNRSQNKANGSVLATGLLCGC